jgi:hypothetical protein
MYMGYICRFAVLEIKGWVVDQVVELLTQHEQGPGFNFWKEGRKEGRKGAREGGKKGKNYRFSWLWWHIPVFPARGRWRKEDCEFKANLAT